MTRAIEVKVNGKKVPLNRFLKKLITRLVLAVVSSLKEVDEQVIETVDISVALDNEEK
ncbi:MAG: hypothetical protein ACTSYD_00255 [Candidatus Heimdallarchaeaceae archaeon]